MRNTKKIVITGASGFLGRHLVNRLKADKRYKVFALSSHPEELKQRIDAGDVTFLYKDALNDGDEILFDAIVVNCAYPRNSTGAAIADGLKYIQGVFEAAVKHQAAAIINISSQSVYSQQRTEAATEDTPVCLESPYAVGKYAVELMLESICRVTETKHTSLRMASLIGPGFDQRIVNKFVRKILNGESVTVVRQQKQMGFLDVEDAVGAVVSLIDTPVVQWKSVYNAGNGKGYTVERIYEEVAFVLKDKVPVEKPIIETGTETSTTAVSYAHLHADTGFEPGVELSESIRRIFAHM